MCDHTVWCDVFTCFFLMRASDRGRVAEVRGCLGAAGRPGPVTGAAADEYNLNVQRLTVTRLSLSRRHACLPSQSVGVWGVPSDQCFPITHTFGPGLWRIYFAVNGIIHRAHKVIQGDDCRPRRRSWLRFPWLSPIRNSFELRVLCRRSYFGPRTCGRGITNVSKLAGS